MNVTVKRTARCSCLECVFSVSLDWVNSEDKLAFCMRPEIGHIGNWSQRIVKAEQNTCDHFTRKRNKLTFPPPE